MTRLFHFSEDPAITLFRPHVAATSMHAEPRVWTVDEAHAPSYWFPRQCPRACCWLRAGQTREIAPGLLAPGAARMHAIQRDWLPALRACRLYAYEFDPAPFTLDDAEGGFWIARDEVRPIDLQPVGDLVAKHEDARIELRVVDQLKPVIEAIVASGLGFSIIRARNLS
jgi:hypothetical protein